MRFGAIDIGSNAARLLVKDIRQKDGAIIEQKISFIRVPIRLGEDVFETGIISEAKEESLLKTLKGFRYLLGSARHRVVSCVRDQFHPRGRKWEVDRSAD